MHVRITVLQPIFLCIINYPSEMNLKIKSKLRHWLFLVNVCRILTENCGKEAQRAATFSSFFLEGNIYHTYIIYIHLYLYLYLFIIVYVISFVLKEKHIY